MAKTALNELHKKMILLKLKKKDPKLAQEKRELKKEIAKEVRKQKNG